MACPNIEDKIEAKIRRSWSFPQLQNNNNDVTYFVPNQTSAPHGAHTSSLTGLSNNELKEFPTRAAMNYDLESFTISNTI